LILVLHDKFVISV